MCSHCNIDVIMVPVSTVCWIVVASVLVTIIISWLIFRKLKLNNETFKRFCQCIEQSIENCEDWFSVHWYTVLLVICSVFVLWHLEKCMTLKFTSDFNGYNTIFIFWLILLIIPLFEKFEVSGLSIKTRRQVIDESFKATMKATNSERTLNAEELELLHKNGGKNE